MITLQKSKLSSAMHLEGCHFCRLPYATDAITVKVMTSETTTPVFEGVLDLVVHAVVGEEGKVSVEDYPTQVQFTVTKEAASSAVSKCQILMNHVL